ncbi:hypothetical protein BAURA63_03259 [Brevibacterium aurantiacum]|uniref:Uncharacterized protein n=2 Tax=Brevibacterium aurantiacum TaxID=273384 RepID=A0A2H1IHH1_BREAU|nr:hypothetical protein BAUR920_01047 [Brevibacterium aurantiacum]SMX98249.1 hypothetical protein BAURA63_03259 [Brevibacterium aurantiacum]SMY01139.1 hypothetical protein BAURA86_03025 [Brevibacterium aurantiacum]
MPRIITVALKWGNSLIWKSESMKAIPRLIAGTAVVLAAVLTTAPVTAGIADYILNPGQQPTKRAAPALTGSTTAPVTTSRTRDDDNSRDDETRDDETRADETRDRTDDAQPNAETTTSAQTTPSAETTPDGGGIEAAGATALSDGAGLVAHTAADAQSRVADLAGDLQAGVDAGEFSQADADRVLGDLSSYIKGERTWPERTWPERTVA